jgi:outer membrane protein assembly factor BamB
MQLAWTYDAKSPIDALPAVAGGLALVGATDGRVHAVRLDAGAAAWVSRPGGIKASRVATSGELALAAIMFTKGNRPGYLAALDLASGKVRWRVTAPGSAQSSPVVAGRLAFFASFAHRRGDVLAVDLASQRVVWEFTTGDWIVARVGVDGDGVLVPCHDGRVYCLDAGTGALRWAAEIGRLVDNTPVVADGTVYVGGHGGVFRAIDLRNGRERWRFAAQGPVSTRAVVDGDRVLFGSWDRFVYALDRATGRAVWRVNAGSEVLSTPAIAGEAVVFGCEEGRIYAVDRVSGSMRDEYTPASDARIGAIKEAPVVAGSLVIVPSHDGRLRAFRL